MPRVSYPCYVSHTHATCLIPMPRVSYPCYVSHTHATCLIPMPRVSYPCHMSWNEANLSSNDTVPVLGVVARFSTHSTVITMCSPTQDGGVGEPRCPGAGGDQLLRGPYPALRLAGGHPLAGRESQELPHQGRPQQLVCHRFRSLGLPDCLHPAPLPGIRQVRGAFRFRFCGASCRNLNWESRSVV